MRAFTCKTAWKAAWEKARLPIDGEYTKGPHNLKHTFGRRLRAAGVSFETRIEVYFKEAKQHLGFLKEQSNHYEAYIASIHLTAIRFCLLVIAKQTQGADSIA